MATSKTKKNRAPVLAWAFYDWANSAFAASVMTAFFPIFFKRYWNQGVDPTEVTFRLGIASSISSVVIVILAPILGAIADKGSLRKKFLLFFVTLGVGATAALIAVDEGNWLLAIGVYTAALLGFLGGNVFYDSLLVEVSDEQNVDRVSAFGFAAGYVGSGLLLVVHGVGVIPNWEALGFTDISGAVKSCIFSVAIWWAIFAVPIFLFVKEPERKGDDGNLESNSFSVLTSGFFELRNTLREIRKFKTVLVFLLAYWFYIDGVDTVILMAVDYGASLGFSEADLIGALILTQFVGAPAAIAFGRIGERLGPQMGLYIGIFVYACVCTWGYFVQETWEFYAMAIAIGLVQGGVQSLSRSLFVRIIPNSKAGAFFGFYNMLGKFAAVLGPFLVAIVAKVSGDPRLPILSIIVLFVVGFWFLRRVDVREGQRTALAYESKSSAL